jgi:predicted outer membrane lipoprotein
MIEVHWSWLLAVLLLAAIGATVVVALIWETFENRKIKRRWRNHD